MANCTNIRYSNVVTQQQRSSTIWFVILSVGLTIFSIISSQKISQSNLNSLVAAAEQSLQLWQSSPPPIPQEQAAQNDMPAAPQATQTAIVKRVIDGDTFELESGQKVRLIGINTPELHHPQKGVECFGKEAFTQAQQLLEGKTVVLQMDVSETDRYGRLLRYVWVEDVFINQDLVSTGFAYASAYPPDIHFQEILRSAETQARAQKVGLWSSCPVEN